MARLMKEYDAFLKQLESMLTSNPELLQQIQELRNKRMQAMQTANVDSRLQMGCLRVFWISGAAGCVLLPLVKG
jgi:hypothetical protein